MISWYSITRVNLRRVTAASYLPEFKIGSQQNVNVQEGAEVAGEAVEMAELRRGKLMVVIDQIQFSQNKYKLLFLLFFLHSQTDHGKQDQDSEECVFYWQQKMFSQVNLAGLSVIIQISVHTDNKCQSELLMHGNHASNFSI